MEPRDSYYARFETSPKMVDWFPDVKQRREVAEETFAAKWEEALVRVTKLDGTQFFID